MPKGSSKSAFPPLTPLPYDPTNPGIPNELMAQLNNLRVQAQANQGAPSYGEAHPIINGIRGFQKGGIPGIFAAKADDQVLKQLRNQQIQKDYQDAITNALTNFNTLDSIGQVGNETNYARSLQQAGIDQQQVNPNLPKIPEGARMSHDALGTILGGAFTPAGVGFADRVINQQQKRSYGFGSGNGNLLHNQQNVQGGTLLNNPATATNEAIQGNTTLQGNVSAFDPESLPLFLPESIGSQIIQAQTSTANNALGEGVKQNQFYNPDVVKQRIAEIAKTQSETAENQANVGYLNAGASLRNRTPGGSAGPQPNNITALQGALQTGMITPDQYVAAITGQTGGNSPVNQAITKQQALIKNIQGQMTAAGITNSSGVPYAGVEGTSGFFGIGGTPANPRYKELSTQLDQAQRTLNNLLTIGQAGTKKQGKAVPAPASGGKSSVPRANKQAFLDKI